MTTPNLGLTINNASSGSAVTFLTWRLSMNGDSGTSNINLIDAWAGQVNGSIVALTSACVTNGNAHNHNGGDGGTISHSYLSGSGTNSHAAIDAFISSKATANGLASLNASGSVTQSPAMSSGSRTENSIPYSDSNGTLDKWVTQKVRGTIINPVDIYPSASRIVLMKADADIYVTRLHLSTNTSSNTLNATLIYASDTTSFSNLTNIVTCNTTGTFTTTSIAGSAVSSGSYVALQFDSSPSSNIKQVYFEMFYMYSAT